MTELPKITPATNGPLIVENPPNIIGAVETDVAGKPKVALCYCGASANTPFCDGTHYTAAWSRTVAWKVCFQKKLQTCRRTCEQAAQRHS